MSTFRRSLRKTSLCAAWLLLAASGGAGAQSLLSLYTQARAYDSSYQAALAQYQADLASAEQARAGLLPNVALSAGALLSLIHI